MSDESRLAKPDERVKLIELMLGASHWESKSGDRLPSCERCRRELWTVAAWDSQEARELCGEREKVAGPFTRLLPDPKTGALRQQWYYYVRSAPVG